MKRFVFVLLAYLFMNFATAQTALQKKIDVLANDPDLKHASLGICVIDVESGNIIAQFEKDKSLIPASSLKSSDHGNGAGKAGSGFSF